MFARLNNAVRRLCGKPSVYHAFDMTITVIDRYKVKINYGATVECHRLVWNSLEFGPSVLISNRVNAYLFYKKQVIFTTESLVIENNGKFYDLYLNQLKSTPTEIEETICGVIAKSPQSRIFICSSEQIVIFNYRPDILLEGCNSEYKIIYVDMERKEIMNYKRCSLLDCAIGRLEDYSKIVRPIDLTNCRLCVKNNNSIFRHEDTYFCIVVYNDDPTRKQVAIELYPYSGFRTKPAIRT